jgi:hypothetical protein
LEISAVWFVQINRSVMQTSVLPLQQLSNMLDSSWHAASSDGLLDTTKSWILKSSDDGAQLASNIQWLWLTDPTELVSLASHQKTKKDQFPKRCFLNTGR